MRRLAVFGLLAVLALPASAAEHYIVDTEHSSIRFTVPYDFMILGQLRGEFREFEGSVIYDEGDPTASSVVVDIVTSSVDTKFEARDIGLKSDEYLAVETYPHARFEGRGLELGEHGWIVAGELAMRGFEHELELELELLDLGETLVASGTAVLSREAFGVAGPALSGDIVIGDEVSIDLHIVLRLVEPTD